VLCKVSAASEKKKNLKKWRKFKKFKTRWTETIGKRKAVANDQNRLVSVRRVANVASGNA
jgi:hypothetical protein